ncbi:MAG: baseplate J/gp47 family protein [Nitrosomonadales bacterium]|nr:baseplate J/gp47 family protein [Nitrosomonadales bacterium]
MAVVDLSLLPPPTVIEPLDFEAILAAIKADLTLRHPDASAVLNIESEPLTKLCEVAAYRELVLRARINDAAKAMMLAYATGVDLDHLVALYGISRFQSESDNALRSRAQLSLEGLSVAGPKQAYRFHAMSASDQVRDVDVQSPAGGQVRITVLTHPTPAIPNGIPGATLLETVLQAVSADTVRPLCDQVEVVAPVVIHYTVQASLICLPGPDTQTVLAAAQAACAKYVSDQFYLGRDIAISGLLAALHQPGVMRVNLTSPAAHITISADQVAYCTSINVTFGGTDQ